MNIEALYDLFCQCESLSVDSRNLSPGSIFVALKGDKFDGNRFAAEALKNGARYAIIDNPDFNAGDSYLLVEDSLTALQQIATLHRKNLKIPFLAITGSNGKTTTKELVYRVLSKKYKTHYTIGNLNNHIGVPLTLLKTKPEHQIAVIEMGANHQGEITTLCQFAQPDFGLITNIGKAHIGGFGGVEGVIKGKTELYQYLKYHFGLAFVHANDPLLLEKSEDICRITYGSRAGANYQGKGYVENDLVSMDYRWLNKQYKISSQLPGLYNFANIMAAVCIGLYFEVDPLKIVEAVENYTPDNNRSQVVKTNSNTVILDAYNANPGSMDAAITNLKAMKSKHRVAIIGDMLELGDYAADEHLSVIRKLNDPLIHQVILIGPQFMELRNHHHFLTFSERDAAAEWLTVNPVKDSLVLIKASRGIGLEPLIKYL